MINFPIDPEIGQNYTDPSTDITWVWTGETWDFECELPPSSSYIGVSPIDVTTFTDEIGNKIITVSHEESGVVPGTYNSFTVDEFGHIIDTSTETVGHIIQNSGSDMPQRRYLDFRRMIVTDNQLFNQTVVTRPPSVSVGVDPPTEDLLEGDEWVDSLNWKKYIRYNDYWVETGKVEPSSSSGSFEGLNDTFTFEGNAGKFAVVNDAETALIPVNLPSGGITDVGAGLSIDGDGNPRLGTENGNDPIQYKVGELFQLFLEANEVNSQSFVFNLNESTLSKAELYFQSYFAWSQENFVEGGLRSFLSENTQIVKLNYSGRLDETAIIFDNFVEFYEKGIEVLRTSIFPDPGAYQGLLIGNTPRKNTNERIAFIDEILQRGAGDAADYSATKQDLDYVTKLMLDKYYPEAVERENNTILFDKDYVIGNAAARTGNILFDFTGAKLMSTTMMLHNHSSIPTFPAQSVIIGGFYEINVNNYIYFQLTRKTSGSEIVLVTISQPI